jgi:glycolate oxidase iron-sulfur subunit
MAEDQMASSATARWRLFFAASDTPKPGAKDLGLIDACVHCGFCLSTCPTYLLWGEEMDSPRGRIYLMRELAEGEAMGAVVQTHFDRCLGCMACMTACPSGVRYDELLATTRSQIESSVDRPWQERLLRRLVFGLFPYKKRLRAASIALRFYQRSGLADLVRSRDLLRHLPAVFRTLESIAPEVPRFEHFPETVRARGQRRGVVAMLTGCVQSVLFSPVNAATVRVLVAEGFDVVIPREQGCCGALSAHAGREEEAKGFARRLIDAFEKEGVNTVVVNSAGCGSAMKEYAHLLRDDPAYADRAERFSTLVRDVSEFLAGWEPRATRHPLDVIVAYHDACHLAHAQGVRSQPRDLLQAIPGLVLREVGEGEICCGSAGIYNLVQPETARELGDRKARNVIASGAELLVAANPGCTLQVAAALSRLQARMPVAHTIEVIDASIHGVSTKILLAK